MNRCFLLSSGSCGSEISCDAKPPPGTQQDFPSRDEEVEGVYRHRTALTFYDLSDLNPSKLHMTVPMDFRRNSEIPGILVLHYADLPESDVQTAQGFKFARPLRAVLDLIEAGTVERNFIRQAHRQAVERGLITRQQIRNTRMSGPAREFVKSI